MFCTNCDSNSDISCDEDVTNKRKKLDNETQFHNNADVKNTSDDLRRSMSEPDLSMSEDEIIVCNKYLTSTPACTIKTRNCPDILFTPEDRKSMSPITKSTKRMCQAMQVKYTITN